MRATLRRRARSAGALALALTGAACSSTGPGTGAANVATQSTIASTVAPHREEPVEMSVASVAPVATAEPPAPRGRCVPSSGAGPRQITVWYSLGGDVAPDVLQRHVAEYEAAHADVDVELVHMAGTPEDRIAALDAASPEQLPDIVLGSTGTVRMQYDSGWFVDPQECTGGTTPESLAGMFPGIAHTYTVDGVLRAAPFNVSVPLLMYDRNRWIDAGLDPDDPPGTLDELYATIDTLVDSGAVAAGLALYDRSATWLVSQAAAGDGRLLIEPANGHAGIEISRVEFEQPGVAEMLARLHDLKAAGRVAWLRENSGGVDDLLRLVNPVDTVGMTFHTSASLGDIYLLLANEDFSDVEVGAAPLPGGGAAGGQIGGGAWWLVDRGDPGQAAAAWDLVDWLVQPEQIGEFAAATGYAPTSEAAAASAVLAAAWEQHPEMRIVYEIVAAIPADDAAGLQIGPEAEVQRQFELALAWPIDNGDDPVTKLREYEVAAQAMLDTYAATVAG